LWEAPGPVRFHISLFNFPPLIIKKRVVRNHRGERGERRKRRKKKKKGREENKERGYYFPSTQILPSTPTYPFLF